MRSSAGFAPLRTQNRNSVAGMPTASVQTFVSPIEAASEPSISGQLSPPAWMPRICFNWLVAIRMPDAVMKPVSKRGLLATYAAGVAMPLTNPKPIIFYLSLLPAFFDLSAVTPVTYLIMVSIMLAMYALTASVHVGLAHKARDWLKAKGVKRWADLVTAVIMAAVAILLLTR